MQTMILTVLAVASMPFTALSVDVSSSFEDIVSNYNVPGLVGRRLDTDTLSAAGVAGVRVRGQNSNRLQTNDVVFLCAGATVRRWRKR